MSEHDDDRPDEELPADSQPPEIEEIEPTDPADLPPDEGEADEQPEPEPHPDDDPLPDLVESQSVSGLRREQRIEAKRLAVRAAALGFAHRGALHYTQDWKKRWEGIAKGLVAKKGGYPRNADCSSFATWCLWNGLKVRFGVGDTVNGDGWRGGYTGTMLSHGRPVQGESNFLLGDLVLYGVPGTTGKHVAILVGDGWVISHGSEPGPYKLRWNYRSDVIGVRRYI